MRVRGTREREPRAARRDRPVPRATVARSPHPAGTPRAVPARSDRRPAARFRRARRAGPAGRRRTAVWSTPPILRSPSTSATARSRPKAGHRDSAPSRSTARPYRVLTAPAPGGAVQIAREHRRDERRADDARRAPRADRAGGDPRRRAPRVDHREPHRPTGRATHVGNRGGGADAGPHEQHRRRPPRRARTARVELQHHAHRAADITRAAEAARDRRESRAAHTAHRLANQHRRAAPDRRPRTHPARRAPRRRADRAGGAHRPRDGARRPRDRRARRRAARTGRARRGRRASASGAPGAERAARSRSPSRTPRSSSYASSAVERALANLVDNACKFSAPPATVELRVQGSTIEVLDRGPGIADDDRAHVFDRFYRAPAARTMAGSGLGLSIVKQIATLEGGSVELLPRAGGGTVARLVLPAVTSRS